MRINKLVLGSLLLLVSGCLADAKESHNTDNPNITVQLLFTHEGCTVYRFTDEYPRYYVVCEQGSARTLTEEIHSSGKATTRIPVEIPTVTRP